MKRGIAGMQAATMDFGDLQSRIDVQAVLDYYGAENQRPEANHDGTTEIIHSCLIDRVEPHHANGDANPSAAANLDKKLYICYSYWSGSIIDLIAKLERKDHPHEAADAINQFLDGTTKQTDILRADLEKRLAPEGGVRRAHLPAYSERVLQPWAFTHPYVVERGIDLDTASLLQIGYDERTNRITIPHFWKGQLVGWQSRAIPGREGQWPATEPSFPKYKNSPGFPKSESLYLGDQAAGADLVVVVESPFSAIKAVALGLRHPVVATFGAKVTDTQIALMTDWRKVVIWMDDDTAGRQAEKRLVDRLRAQTTVNVVLNDAGMDLGDYDDVQQVQAKIETAVPGWLRKTDYDQEKRWARRSQALAR